MDSFNWYFDIYDSLHNCRQQLMRKDDKNHYMATNQDTTIKNVTERYAN